MGFDYRLDERFVPLVPVGAGPPMRADTAGVSMQNPPASQPGRLTQEEIAKISTLPPKLQHQIAEVASNPELTPEQIAEQVRGMLASRQQASPSVLSQAALLPQYQPPLLAEVTQATTAANVTPTEMRTSEENNYGVEAARMECQECGTYGQFVQNMGGMLPTPQTPNVNAPSRAVDTGRVT